MSVEEAHILLPDVVHRGVKSVEEALVERRSVREYTPEPISLAELAQLLWAAQGITGADNLRTAPSAGALYPLEVYAVAGKVKGISSGIYKYHPVRHSLVRHLKGDIRGQLAAVALHQSCVKDAAVVLIITAIYDRTTSKYGSRGIRYVDMEVGHAAENVHLQAVALGLGMVMIGAFEDLRVKQILDLPNEEQPLYLLPIGRKYK
jgi:SagB-type dehydrogenase family enzyme